MADFYSIMAQAVSALDDNTRDARRTLYERARTALDGHGTAALKQSEFLIARISLEEAIAKVEAEAQREHDVLRRQIATPRSTIASRGRTFEPGARGRGLLKRFWTHAFRGEPDGASGNFSGEKVSGSGRDTWLSDVLARASREEHEDGINQTFESQRTSTRNGSTGSISNGASASEPLRVKHKRNSL